MKKFAKMSLVAAVAVAGLTSSASAVSLEKAIQGVDVSGQFRFRAEERNAANATATDVEVEVTAKVPVNDNVTAIFKIDTTRNTNDANNQANDFFDVEDYYFQYVNGPLTVNAGQQNIPGRMTDGLQGNGVVALYNAGAFTVGAASFMNHNVGTAAAAANATLTPAGAIVVNPAVAGNRGNMINSVIAMGSVGPVSLLGQWADFDKVGSAYNLKADAKIGPAMVGAEYVTTDVDNSTAANDDLDTLKVYASAKLGMVSAKATFVKVGEDGAGSLHSVTTAGAAETPSEFLLWQLQSVNFADTTIWAIDASVAVTDKISIRAAYADADVDVVGANDQDEILGQISYKMSSNLNTYIRYSKLDMGTATDSDRARIEVRYSF